MDSETKGWCFVMACVTIIVVAIASCITYYNLEDDKMLERLVNKGVSPMVVRCVDSDWSSVSSYAICSKIMENHRLTKEQARALIKELEK